MLAVAVTALSLLLPAPVTALAADGPRVAVASGCEVRVWTPPARRGTLVGRQRCDPTSTGTGIAAIALAGTRALWLHHAGGNIREWSLWTSTTARPQPRRLAFVARDVDARPPVVLGEGDRSRFGDLLPYAVGRSVVVLRSNGSRAFTWRAPADVTALGANLGVVAVAAADGSVTTLDAQGDVEGTTSAHGAAASAAFVAGNGVVLQRGRVLEYLSGGEPRTLPVGARLVDAHGFDAVFVLRGFAYLIEPGRPARNLGRADFAQVEEDATALARGRVVRTG